ncbi:protein At-4/1-like [Bidens hawaiensis]|uniref:protein At-4/1-like n=1 Tax=Bidens hawaiensis TaxID=980011 RepID=UPI0040490713
MAATSDEALDSLLSDFDQIHSDFSQGLVEIQRLQSKCNSEIKRREAVESTVNTLRSENERVMKLYKGSISKLANQLERRNNCDSLKDELKRVYDEHTKKENEFRNTINQLKYDYENRIKGLEAQIKDNLAHKKATESTINQLHQDLTAHRNHVEALSKRLNQVHSDVEMTYQFEIQDLKDCLMMEQEEKNGLNRKLQSLEKELLISRSKLAESENKQDLSSNRHVETLKQKVMKLRKENEVLKRRLVDSKEC